MNNSQIDIQSELSKIRQGQEKTIDRLVSLESRVTVQEVLLQEIKSYARNGNHVYITQSQLINWIFAVLFLGAVILGVIYFSN